jgi:hypothetical protein
MEKYSTKTWIKLPVKEWLESSTRFELDPGQRSIWADLLALGGRSRFEGIIASGKNDNSGEYIGYPITWYCATLHVSEDLFKSTINVCEEKNKIRIESDLLQNLVIRLVNWAKYQSEFSRQKSYRGGKCLFENSMWFDYSVFQEALQAYGWEEEKIKHYYEAAQDYSLANNATYSNWIAAVRNWERKERQQNNRKVQHEHTHIHQGDKKFL